MPGYCDKAGWPDTPVPRQLRVTGLHYSLYLLAIVAAVLASGVWRPGIPIPLGFGIVAPLEGVLRIRGRLTCTREEPTCH